MLIGSGLNLENAKELLAVADGAIVGSSIKIDGQIHHRVDPEQVKRLTAEITS